MTWRAIWDASNDLAGTLAERLLRDVGVEGPIPRILRYHGHLEAPGLPPGYPALLAAVQDPSGAITAVRAILLDPDGTGRARVRDPELTIGAAGGGAIRLDAQAAHMLLAPNVFVGLDARQAQERPVWVAPGALAAVELPAWVIRVDLMVTRTVAAETDAEVTARALRRRGLDVRLIDAPLDRFSRYERSERTLY